MQLNLIHAALRFRNIFRECGNIPENIKNQPDEIIKFYDKIKRMEKTLDRDGDVGSDEAGVSLQSVVGAKKEDLSEMGLTSYNKSLAEEAKKNGGSLNKYQLVEFFNKK